MIKWFVDKDNKIPLYLQLKDLVKYYISTGAIRENQKLPTVNELAREVEINFETVRKAYKELEKEGLITTKRGRGTFADGHSSLKSASAIETHIEPDVLDSVKSTVRHLLQAGKEIEKIEQIFLQAIRDVSLESSKQVVIFTECNLLQVNEISTQLKNYLNLNVRPVMLENLLGEVKKTTEAGGILLAVITTGFHINEVRNMLHDLPLQIDFLVTNMSPETRREIEARGKDSHFGFICRDKESISLYKDLLKLELGLNTELSCSVFEDQSLVPRLLQSVDVLLVSPTVYDQVKKMAPPNLPIFNVFDRIDPMSLAVVKDRIMALI
jgi:GntR family transcriptional regulator